MLPTNVTASLIRRPIPVYVAMAALTVIGAVAWVHIPAELAPPAQFPRLEVTTAWPGAAPEAVEAYVTAPLDRVVRQVAGVAEVSSVSEERAGTGLSRVEVKLDPSTSIEFARLDIAERIAALRDVLPPGAAAPRIEPYLPPELAEREQPSMRLSVTGPVTDEALSVLAQVALAPAVRRIPGVGTVELGTRSRAVLAIELDEAKALAHSVTPATVRAAIEASRKTADAGTIHSNGIRHTITILAPAADAAELTNLPLAAPGGRFIRIGDVARVELVEHARVGGTRIDGEPAVVLGVTRAAGSDALRVARNVEQQVQQLRSTLPSGVSLQFEADEHVVLRSDIDRFTRGLLLSAAAVFAVAALAFGSLRTGVALVATLLIAALATTAAAAAAGLSVNRFTLAGFTTSLGAVVGIATSVLAMLVPTSGRVRRPRLDGRADRRAVYLFAGCSAAAAAIVFIPFALVRDELQLVYRPLVLVAGFALLAGVTLALILLPVLAPHLRSGHFRGEFGNRIARRHRTALAYGLSRAWWVVGVSVAALAMANVALVRYAAAALSDPPRKDAPYIDVTVEPSRGSDQERIETILHEFERRVAGHGGVRTYVTDWTPERGQLRVQFTDSALATPGPVGLKEELEALGRQFGGVNVRVFGLTPSFYGTTGGPPVYAIRVRGYDYLTVRRLAEDLGQRLRSFPRVGAVDVNSDGAWLETDRHKELVFAPDRARLGVNGLSVREVVQRIEALVGAADSRMPLLLLGAEADLLVRLASHADFDVDVFLRTPVPVPSGGTVPLGTLGTLTEVGAQARISRERQRYTRTVAYEFRGPDRLGDRLHSAVLGTTLTPPGYTIDAGEAGGWTSREQRQVYGSLLLAVVLLFMLAAVVFESLRQPICVLLALPMGFAGTAAAFLTTGVPFTREALIGSVIMVGMAVASSILLVTRYNHLRRDCGVALAPAVLRGTAASSHPILLSSLASAAAMLPFIDFSPSGRDLVSATLLASAGGVIASGFLVMLVMPPLYYALEMPRGAAHPV